MSVEVVDRNHYEKLLFILDSTEKEISIVSPFIKDETAKLLCTILSGNPDIHCTIITRFVRQEFVDKASSLLALKHLRENGATLYALRYLHTKLYLVDDHIAMMGSANFTTGGFRLNHELSLLMENEPAIIADLHEYFNRMLAEIIPQEDSAITDELIASEAAAIEKAISNWTYKEVKYSFDKSCQHGAVIGHANKENQPPTPDSIQDIIADGEKVVSTSHAWIKFEGIAEEREDPEAQYSLFAPKGFPNGITCFPRNKRPVGIKEGDCIYLAVVTQDTEGNNTPVIVGRATTYGYEEGNMATDDMIKQTEWMERFPAYIRVKEIEYLMTAQKNGISLIHLLTTLGTDMYPTTVGTAKPYPELRAMHYRRSHMRITTAAAAYIDKQFDILAKKYGTNIHSL